MAKRAGEHPLALRRKLTDPDGIFGLPEDVIDDVLLTGDVAAVAEQLSAYGDTGVEQVVFTVAAGDWFRQAELIAEAARSMR